MLDLAARVFLALVFVVAGFGKLTGFDATVGYVGMLTNESVAPTLTVLAIIFEFGGGLMLLFNWKTALAVDMRAFNAVEIKGAEASEACQGFADLVTARRIVHPDDPLATGTHVVIGGG